jgi:hypothetical protein
MKISNPSTASDSSDPARGYCAALQQSNSTAWRPLFAQAKQYQLLKLNAVDNVSLRI